MITEWLAIRSRVLSAAFCCRLCQVVQGYSFFRHGETRNLHQSAGIIPFEVAFTTNIFLQNVIAMSSLRKVDHHTF